MRPEDEEYFRGRNALNHHRQPLWGLASTPKPKTLDASEQRYIKRSQRKFVKAWKRVAKKKSQASTPPPPVPTNLLASRPFFHLKNRRTRNS
ncbi:hypothetical protein LZ31DRAFT_555043 [Colletotrichum somersetense]|nr:hypothetical protein LZ31DRAFT_555043 [Colletotrichum somersetense]